MSFLHNHQLMHCCQTHTPSQVLDNRLKHTTIQSDSTYANSNSQGGCAYNSAASPDQPDRLPALRVAALMDMDLLPPTVLVRSDPVDSSLVQLFDYGRYWHIDNWVVQRADRPKGPPPSK